MPDKYTDHFRNTDNDQTIQFPTAGQPASVTPPTNQKRAPQQYSGSAQYNDGYQYDPYADSQNAVNPFEEAYREEHYNQQPQYSQQQYAQQQQYSQQQQYAQQPQYSQQAMFVQQPAYPQQRVNESAPKQKKKRRKHKNIVTRIITRLLLTLLILFLLLFGIYSCTALSIIKKLDYRETGDRDRADSALRRSYVTSVLIIGTDGRSDDDTGRSDTMILVSINKHTKKICMTSFMRDCYVNIPGHGWDKLNAAYNYGGPELVMDTIENNFYVRIDDYVCINFNSFASIVDSVGGIDIEVSDSEAEAINVILQSEVNELMGDDKMDDMLSSGGKLHLNGKQALAYSRIRYVGNADFERTERQRTVMEKIIKKMRSFKPTYIKKLTNNVMPQLTTNMKTLDLYLLSLRVPFIMKYDFVQVQVPAEDTYYSDNVELYGGIQNVLSVDFDANYDIIKSEVFDD